LSKAISRLKVEHLFRIVPTAGHISCKANGYQILFAGLDDVEKIKSITPKKGVITDIWIEEATETGPNDVKQLRKRLRGLAEYDGERIRKRVILSFNPIYRTHWIVNEYFNRIGWRDEQREYLDDSISILKTTHVDNEFLDPDDHAELENESDPYWKEVYTYGNWGILGDSILTNWRVDDLSDKKEGFDKIRNGLDFGYSSDPNAFVRLHYDRQNKRIYVFEGWSEKELTNPQIADRLRPIVKDEAVFCDDAEPKSIQELRDCGIDARKSGKIGGEVAGRKLSSLLYAIQWLQQHEIIVDESLQPIVNELTIWQWRKDKNGDSLPIPEDKNDHYISATIYATSIERQGFFGDVL
jgi:phage terminase large subunit